MRPPPRGTRTTLGVRTVCAVGDAVSYEGPRGVVRLRGNHLGQRLYLARADVLGFRVVARL
ncbi:hypothetical protein [Streptomyces humi]|uniref:hypothetical protein n=1 Tax=Streptomyces humi TaxID=1428620 RepID=UPI0006286D4D|nr:hypothetical protein [Streptomyces humi]